MLNKKRLAMMAVAASMVLPNNLVYLATNTPVFAENNTSDQQKEVQEIKFNDLFAKDTNGWWRIKESTDLNKSYKLTEGPKDDTGEDLVLTTPIYIKEKNLTLDLNGLTITTTSEKAIWSHLSTLTLTHGTIKSTSTDTSKIGSIIYITGENSVLNLGSDNEDDKVTLIAEDSLFYGVALMMGTSTPAKNAQVTIKNSEIKASSGLTVSGDVYDGFKDTGPTVNLDGVTITAISKGKSWENTTYTETDDPNKAGFLKHSSVGIYQAGPSTLIINNSTVTSDCTGIETREGTLKVINSTVTGNGTDTPKASSSSGESTTENVGISLNPYYAATKAGQIKIDIRENTTVTGSAALAITDTKSAVKDDGNSLPEINVTNSKLEGTYSAIYTTEYIPFTLTNTVAKTLTQFGPSSGNTMEPVKEEDEFEKVPYTIVLDLVSTEEETPISISKDILENFATVSEEDSNLSIINVTVDKNALPEAYQELPLTSFENGLNEETLAQALTKKSTEVGAPDPEDEAKTITPNYIFAISGLTKIIAEDEGITVNGTPTVTVQLNSNSIIQLGEKTDSTLAPDPGENSGKEAETESAPIPMSEIDEVAPSVKYALCSEIGTSVNQNTINTYLKNNGMNYHVDTNLNFTEGPITILGEAAPLKLNEDGFIQLNLLPGAVQNTNKNPGGNKPKPKPEQPADEPVIGTPTTMYRLYNRLTGEHLYTIDKNERDSLLTSDTWKDEGEGWVAPSISDYPVYRLLNPNNGDHHYTTDKNEFDTLPSYGWVAEGVAFFSADKENPENVLLHRLYNPNAEGAGSHHYTADTNERDTLVAQGWKYEGLAWAGLPANK